MQARWVRPALMLSALFEVPTPLFTHCERDLLLLSYVKFPSPAGKVIPDKFRFCLDQMLNWGWVVAPNALLRRLPSHWLLCEKLHCHTCHMIFIVTFPIRFLNVLARHLVPTSTGNELLIVGLRIVSSSIMASSSVSPTSSNSAASSTAVNCPAQSFSTVQVGNYTYEIECMFLKRRCIRRTMANP